MARVFKIAPNVCWRWSGLFLMRLIRGMLVNVQRWCHEVQHVPLTSPSEWLCLCVFFAPVNPICATNMPFSTCCHTKVVLLLAVAETAHWLHESFTVYKHRHHVVSDKMTAGRRTSEQISKRWPTNYIVKVISTLCIPFLHADMWSPQLAFICSVVLSQIQAGTDGW